MTAPVVTRLPTGLVRLLPVPVVVTVVYRSECPVCGFLIRSLQDLRGSEFPAPIAARA